MSWLQEETVTLVECIEFQSQCYKIRSKFKNVKQKNVGMRDMEIDLVTLTLNFFLLNEKFFKFYSALQFSKVADYAD